MFTLSMPRVNSWNNRWSGDDDLYCKARVLTADRLKELPFDYTKPCDFYYDFGDGWAANVHVEVMSSKEANKLKKKSRGFAGYDWMITSILKNGEIKVERD